MPCVAPLTVCQILLFLSETSYCPASPLGVLSNSKYKISYSCYSSFSITCNVFDQVVFLDSIYSPCFFFFPPRSFDCKSTAEQLQLLSCLAVFACIKVLSVLPGIVFCLELPFSSHLHCISVLPFSSSSHNMMCFLSYPFRDEL